jgi:flagellar basal-body rod modification protein FlgD
MAVDSTTGTTGTQAPVAAVPTNPKATLDKDGFLKMFIAQLQHQDPSSPMDTNDSMAQMSSFSMVEQITNMTADNAKSAAVGMIGHDVTYIDPADPNKTATATGTVDSVSLAKDGSYTLTISGTAGIKPESITQVA